MIGSHFAPKIKDNKFLTKLAICGPIAIVLLLSFLRVPYTGIFLDSYIFEFFFGVVKYFVYFILFAILVQITFNIRIFRKIKAVN
jgi:hypothetical protein